MPELTLHATSTWDSPWVFHAMVALEEKGLTYRLEVEPVPLSPARKQALREKSIIGLLPILEHGDVWISESLAISEYLAERFPSPEHPRLFPADLIQRARARQLMSSLRTSMRSLREDRPTTTVFGRPSTKPLSERGQADADELLRIADALLPANGAPLFGEWCIADADLALMLMRLVANGDPVPPHIAQYTVTQWDRRSIGKFLSHLPTTR